MRALPLLIALAACDGGAPPDPPDPTDPCAWNDAPVLQAGFDVATAPIGPDLDIPYGNPPQGGAPYAPFQIRLHTSWDPAGDLPRFALRGEAVDRTSGETIATGEQPQTFFCSNTGPHEGWLYGGELHLRFWGLALRDLQGRQVDVAIHVTLADGAVVDAIGGGALVWTLGRYPGDDDPPDTDPPDTDPPDTDEPAAR